MEDAIDAVLDHVAVAVGAESAAEQRWGTGLGAALVSGDDNGIFRARQYRFANDAKLELLSPSAKDPSAANFVRRFLDRHGSTIHHVTLKVPDLSAALATLDAAGLDVVDVQLADEWWREAFLRPKQVGGLVVQVAWSRGNDEDWARREGYAPSEPSPDAPDLLGPRLRHPDLDAAARLWSLLGSAVERRDKTLLARWPRSPMEILIERGDPPGPAALRMRRTAPRPAEPGIGPAVEVSGPGRTGAA